MFPQCCCGKLLQGEQVKTTQNLPVLEIRSQSTLILRVWYSMTFYQDRNSNKTYVMVIVMLHKGIPLSVT